MRASACPTRVVIVSTLSETASPTRCTAWFSREAASALPSSTRARIRSLVAFSRWFISSTRSSSVVFMRSLTSAPVAANRSVIIAPLASMRSTISPPLRVSNRLIASALAPSEDVTREPASPTISDRRELALSRSAESFSCEPAIVLRKCSALPTMASRSEASSSINERMRRSLSEYERSRLATSARITVSSSLARAKARSMPSPMEATSRRMACESVTICSVARDSGSARRMATCDIECAVRRISCARRTTVAVE